MSETSAVSPFFIYLLATSSCLFADLGCEPARRINDGELELAVKARILVKLVANSKYYISKDGKVDGVVARQHSKTSEVSHGETEKTSEVSA